jgi:hypothetical protein
LKLEKTFHSKVKAPSTNLNAEGFFPISAGSELAWVIIYTNICVWDEVSIAHNHLMTGLDRIFKDLMQYERPFGKKLVVMSGDFRQNLTIIPGGSEAQITDARMKRSPLWNTVKQLGLTENWRGRNRAELERASFEHAKVFLLAMGDVALLDPYPEEKPHLVRLPSSICMSVTGDEARMSKVVREVYGEIPETNENPE